MILLIYSIDQNRNREKLFLIFSPLGHELRLFLHMCCCSLPCRQLSQSFYKCKRTSCVFSMTSVDFLSTTWPRCSSSWVSSLNPHDQTKLLFFLYGRRSYRSVTLLLFVADGLQSSPTLPITPLVHLIFFTILFDWHAFFFVFRSFWLVWSVYLQGVHHY